MGPVWLELGSGVARLPEIAALGQGKARPRHCLGLSIARRCGDTDVDGPRSPAVGRAAQQRAEGGRRFRPLRPFLRQVSS